MTYEFEGQEQPGIPSMSQFASIPTRGERYVMACIQFHKANKAGPHYDLRLVLNDKTASSWACRYWAFKPGEKRLAVRQPEHSIEYMKFSGEIKSGRGTGSVALEFHERVKVIESKKESVKFVILHGKFKGTYVLVQTSGPNWLLMNTTLSKHSGLGKIVEPQKEKYKDTTLSASGLGKDIDILKGKYAIQPKIDGAHGIVVLDANKPPHILSHRISKKTDDFIEHTHKFPGLTTQKVPSSIRRTVLRAEVYGRDSKGKIIDAAKLGGYLNSTDPNAIDRLAKDKVQLEYKVFDVDTYNGKRVTDLTSGERDKLLEKIRAKVPTLPVMDSIAGQSKSDIRNKQKLIASILEGKNTETREGIIIRDPDSKTLIKAKIRPDYDVYIRKIFYGKEGSKYEQDAGGFWYSWTPNGNIVGKVGTGFSDSQRRDMASNPTKWIGRVAVLEAQEMLASGALRAPSFKRLHLDK